MSKIPWVQQQHSNKIKQKIFKDLNDEQQNIQKIQLVM